MLWFKRRTEAWPVIMLLLVLLVLRLPNFFEPYWYGDEAIYLTIGNGLRQGLRLYAEIIDHKTPLIYYFAMTPHQVWFRVLNIVVMVIATTAWYCLAQRLIKGRLPQFLAGLLFVILTTLPWFEGHIPNGELFVMTFVLVGAWLLSHSHLFEQLLAPASSKVSLKIARPDWVWLLATGACFGLAILTKVPALFDLVGLGMLFWFFWTNHFSLEKKRFDDWLAITPKLILAGLTLVVGAVIPIVLSVIYFVTRGSGQAYLDFGLLYNFRYAGSWGLPFSNPVLVWLFSLPGKVTVVAGLIAVLTLGRRWFKPPFQFAAGWFGLALLASLLSNRPYPHYFLQVMPPLALLVGLILQPLALSNRERTRADSYQPFSTGLSIFLFLLLAAILKLLDVGLYQTGSYYANFWRYATGQQTQVEYFQTFNPLMSDNYAAAEIIRASHPQRIFIWGTNPMLYALTQTAPTGRFTVAFHIKDFDAYQETIDDLYQIQPRFIVVMDDETEDLPGLNQYLASDYMLRQEYQHFTLWQRLPRLP